ncbi:Fic family protein [Candidatus Saccharibacteria bacterium]|nr:Fic family protein [Candidatus Saccharibacteria bacterium]
MDNYEKIQELLAKEHRLEQELSGLIYGAPEVRDKKYIYVHLRDSGQLRTRYAGEYSDALYNLILKNTTRAKVIKKELKEIARQLHELGYMRHVLSEQVKRNIDFAKKNLAVTIHSQAILEGVATTFAETESIIDGARVQGMTEKDIRKIVNMKHAWEFILDDDVIIAEDDFALLSRINQLVEEGFYFNAGKLRDVPVNIGGTNWQPEMPIESKIVESLSETINKKVSDIDKAVDLVLFVMKSQIFIDGNKRTAVIFANHFLVKNGLGLLYIPEDKVEEFKKLLVEFYETNKKSAISGFLKKHCLLKI